jgi:hypothetical protein
MNLKPSPQPGRILQMSNFVTKLHEILSDPENLDCCCWSPGGDSFVVTELTSFEERVLPKVREPKQRFNGDKSPNSLSSCLSCCR